MANEITNILETCSTNCLFSEGRRHYNRYLFTDSPEKEELGSEAGVGMHMCGVAGGFGWIVIIL